MMKVPVVLDEITAEINVKAEITLPRSALEIKRIHKTVFVEQCELLPGFTSTSGVAFTSPAKVFLKGFVRKDIEFSAPLAFSSEHCISGDIEDLQVDVPFHTVVPTTIPASEFSESPTTITTSEFLQRKRTDRLETKFCNEKPFCELVSATFIEADFEEIGRFGLTFDKFREKLILLITFKVLQKKQVPVT